MKMSSLCLTKAKRSGENHRTRACAFCGGEHWNDECSRFTTWRTRFERLKGLRACFNCCLEGHGATQCKRTMRCYHCKANHNSALCKEHFPDNRRKGNSSRGADARNASQQEEEMREVYPSTSVAESHAVFSAITLRVKCDKRTRSCAFCDGAHWNDQCPQHATYESRKKQCEQTKRCFNCLRIGHLAKNCWRKHRCYHCKRQHNSALCKKRFARNVRKNGRKQTATMENGRARPRHELESRKKTRLKNHGKEGKSSTQVVLVATAQKCYESPSRSVLEDEAIQRRKSGLKHGRSKNISMSATEHMSEGAMRTTPMKQLCPLKTEVKEGNSKPINKNATQKQKSTHPGDKTSDLKFDGEGNRSADEEQKAKYEVTKMETEIGRKDGLEEKKDKPKNHLKFKPMDFVF